MRNVIIALKSDGEVVYFKTVADLSAFLGVTAKSLYTRLDRATSEQVKLAANSVYGRVLLEGNETYWLKNCATPRVRTHYRKHYTIRMKHAPQRGRRYLFDGDTFID